jgi:dimethylglycine dehydrogenase
MRSHARVVVIGGGAVGASVLYHLALLGWTDVVLLERDELTAGSTWHAAGNCPNFSTNYNVIKLQRYSTSLYARLGEEVGYPINYHVTGSLRLAHGRERMDEFRHVASMAQAQGIDFALLDPHEARRLYPYLELHDLEGALWDPYDGDIDPSQLTQAYAKGARDRGAEVRRFTRVTAIERLASGMWRVSTDKGDITCEHVVNAAGYRGGEIMAMLGRRLPIVAMSHQYLVTEAIPDLAGRDDKLPLLRDPDTSYYLRQERDGLILGPYEATPRIHWQEGIPDQFANQLWPDDLDRLEWYIGEAMARVPILAKAGVQRVINGPIPYSPDGNPYVGPVRGLPNFWQCCCFSFGIAQSGGAGRLMAGWIAEGSPEWDIWSCDSRRFGSYATTAYTTARALELYRREYAIAFPVEEWPAGRPGSVTPLYDRLAAKGARFGARGGWERATWFARPGDEPDPAPSFRRPAWHGAVAEEVRAVRERVGVMDMGGFSKFLVEGPGATAFLDRLVCGRLPRPSRVALTWALDSRGGIVSEFTITARGTDSYYLCSAASAHEHDLEWIEAHLPQDGSVHLHDLSAQLGTLVLAGPRSRDVLATLTAPPEGSAGFLWRAGNDDTQGATDDPHSLLGNSRFPWMSAREIEIGQARFWALRVGYVGELGWELHAPLAQLPALYDAILRAGEAHGISDFGVYAMDSLRMEKGYRGWKGDVTREYSPLMAGFDRFVAFDKGAFTGREALLEERRRGPRERLALLALDEDGDYDAPSCATVWYEGERVGIVSSSAYGHSVRRSLSLAYLRPALAVPGTRLAVEICGRMAPARVVPDPLYDPENLRLRA